MKTRIYINGEYRTIEVEEYQPTAEELQMQRLAEIDNLKAQLAESDYMILKDWEAEKLGLPLPYSPEEIHAIKQPLRDRINELESEISNETK